MRVIIGFFMIMLVGLSLQPMQDVQAQGYDGLFAAPDKTTPAPKAEKDMTTMEKRRANKNKPKAYKSTPAKRAVPTDAFKNLQTPNPQSIVMKSSPAQSADDLKKQALLLKYLQDNADTIKVSKEGTKNVDWEKIKYTRIDGLLPMEYSIKNSVEHYMDIIGDKSISTEKRRQVARMAYKNLMTIADGLRIKASIPETIYKKSGVPESFIKDSIEDTTNSLKMLDAAFKVLRPLQK